MKKRIRKILQTISWKTLKINFKLSLFNLILHNDNETWGFDLLNVRISFQTYSLLRFEFRLPNGTNIRSFSVDDWDILFLYTYLLKEFNQLSDSETWGIKHTGLDKLKLHLLSKIFK
jgi:hypothetical protein